MWREALPSVNSGLIDAHQNIAPLASAVLRSVSLKRGAVLVVGLAPWIVFSLLRRRRHTPPGPPRLPLLGNALQIPSQLQFIQFTEWSQTYGTCHTGSCAQKITRHKQVQYFLSIFLVSM